MKRYILVLALASLVSCAPAAPVPSNEASTDYSATRNGVVERVRYEEDRVTCYVSSTGYGNGISCLRDEL